MSEFTLEQNEFEEEAKDIIFDAVLHILGEQNIGPFEYMAKLLAYKTVKDNAKWFKNGNPKKKRSALRATLTNILKEYNDHGHSIEMTPKLIDAYVNAMQTALTVVANTRYNSDEFFYDLFDIDEDNEQSKKEIKTDYKNLTDNFNLNIGLITQDYLKYLGQVVMMASDDLLEDIRCWGMNSFSADCVVEDARECGLIEWHSVDLFRDILNLHMKERKQCGSEEFEEIRQHTLKDFYNQIEDIMAELDPKEIFGFDEEDDEDVVPNLLA